MSPTKYLGTVVFALTFLVSGYCRAQDVLIKKDGTELNVKVSEIGTTKTKYKLSNNTSGPTIEVFNSELFMIKFEDGTKHIYESGSYDQVSSENELLGKKMYGGYIFHVDESGQHGFVAAPEDISGLQRWGRAQRRVGASSFTDGERNTKLIDAAYGYDYAAGKCAALTAGGFDDWYLPAIDELERLYRGRRFVPGLDAVGRTRYRFDYVSSTEYKNRNDCWAIHFSRHGKHFYYNKRNEYSVRCIRKF